MMSPSTSFLAAPSCAAHTGHRARRRARHHAAMAGAAPHCGAAWGIHSPSAHRLLRATAAPGPGSQRSMPLLDSAILRPQHLEPRPLEPNLVPEGKGEQGRAITAVAHGVVGARCAHPSRYAVIMVAIQRNQRDDMDGLDRVASSLQWRGACERGSWNSTRSSYRPSGDVVAIPTPGCHNHQTGIR